MRERKIAPMKRIRGFHLAKQLVTMLTLVLVLPLLVENTTGQIKKGRRFSAKGECEKCHEMSEFKERVKHKPFDKKECQSCHKPHGMVGVLRLKETGAALCRSCHEETELGLDQPVVHEPAAAGVKNRFPSLIRLMAVTSCSGAERFVIYPMAPASMARTTYCSSSCMVSTSIGKLGCVDLSRPITSNPAIPGMDISMTATSGKYFSTF